MNGCAQHIKEINEWMKRFVWRVFIPGKILLAFCALFMNIFTNLFIFYFSVLFKSFFVFIYIIFFFPFSSFHSCFFLFVVVVVVLIHISTSLAFVLWHLTLDAVRMYTNCKWNRPPKNKWTFIRTTSFLLFTFFSSVFLFFFFLSFPCFFSLSVLSSHHPFSFRAHFSCLLQLS